MEDGLEPPEISLDKAIRDMEIRLYVITIPWIYLSCMVSSGMFGNDRLSIIVTVASTLPIDIREEAVSQLNLK
jgi:hypothetical protein